MLMPRLNIMVCSTNTIFLCHIIYILVYEIFYYFEILKFSGICCLTQLMLDDSNPEMANHMIKIYFSFFKASVKKGEVDTKMVSALLTGVNR